MSKQLFVHKSTASRKLSKMGITDKAQRDALLQQNEAKSWFYNESEARALLAKLLAPELPQPQSDDDKAWEREQREQLAAITPETTKPAKVEKIVGANGRTRPTKGVCKAIYDELDKYYDDLKQVPTPAQAQQMGLANNWHKVTVYRQYGDWLRFKGLKP